VRPGHRRSSRGRGVEPARRALDRQRRWYRCHHLLRDLLRDELERSEPELIPRLHDRAAAWFDANERPALALEHAQAAGDADRAARLFVQVAMPTYGAGRVDTVMHWLGWFEVRGLIEEHPQLAVLGALGEAVLGHVATTERWAGAALAAAGGTDRLMPDGSALKGWLAVMEASLFRHGVARMRADAETARARLAPRSSFQATAMFFEALPYHLDDQPAEADERLAHTVERARQLSLPPAIAMALGERTILAIERRDWAAAAELADEGVTLVEELHLGGYLQAIVVYATAAPPRTAATCSPPSTTPPSPAGCGLCARRPCPSAPTSCSSWRTPTSSWPTRPGARCSARSATSCGSGPSWAQWPARPTSSSRCWTRSGSAPSGRPR
jgi:LuxR family maltose regulon positive regulatory protein